MLGVPTHTVDWLVAIGPWEDEAAIKRRMGWMYWFLRLLKHDARHVILFCPAGEWTLIMQKMPWGLYTDILKIHPLTLVTALSSHRVYKHTVDYKKMSYKPNFGLLFSCVEAVKQVVGINAAFILTPYQLEKRLIKDGCKRLGDNTPMQ